MAAEPAEDPRRWRKLYVLVLAVLAVEIAILWAITRAFT
jgi:hypothetical protein